MSDDPKPTNGELILSRKASLAIKKSGLVKRGLEFAPDLIKRDLKVLIGDADDNAGSSIFEMINALMGAEYNITYMATTYAAEILELAKNNEFDIFILYINNIIFPSENFPIEKRGVKAMQLITYLKSTYKKPLVALSGRPEDHCWSEEKSKQAGADLYFPQPMKWRNFVEAIKSILAGSS